MKKKRTRIEQVLNECSKHIERLEFAKEKMKSTFPLTARKYENLKNEQVVYIDQYLFRFAKLQDAIGQKLMKALLEFTGESAQSKSFRDLFERLEQIGVIKDFDKWNSLRELRNELAHEYADEISENVNKLNTIYKMDKALIKYFNQIEKYYYKISGKYK